MRRRHALCKMLIIASAVQHIVWSVKFVFINLWQTRQIYKPRFSETLHVVPMLIHFAIAPSWPSVGTSPDTTR